MKKKLFSERYGYTKPSDVLITEDAQEEIVNAICTCFDKLQELLDSDTLIENESDKYTSFNLNRDVWIYFLHKRARDFDDSEGEAIEVDESVITSLVLDENIEWYKKLDLIDFCIDCLSNRKNNKEAYDLAIKLFVDQLNSFFEDLNYGYRVIDGLVVPVTSKTEIKTIENAIDDAESNVKLHLQTSLEKLAERPEGDYRNSIKESISAVEAYCRNRTGKDSLGPALAEMEKKGMRLPSSLKSAFNKLYGYANAEDTGIRHPLMDESAEYVPTADEATYMLVTCSAFINYLRKKSVRQ